MKKILLIALLAVAIVGCNDKKKEESPITTPVETKEAETEEVVEKINEILPIEKKETFQLIIPAYYAEEFESDVYKSINNSWLEFREMKGRFTVGKAKYNLSEPIMNECTGDTEIGVFSPEETEPLFFFSPKNKDIKEGKIVSLSNKVAPFWVGNTVEFTFNDLIYRFTATGTLKDTYKYTDDESSKEKTFKNFNDYKLYLQVGDNAKQLVFEQDSFSDTFIKLLFVGDLDGDGKLDFILETSADYEQEVIRVFLSKGAKHYLYEAAMGQDDFSC
ncbi:MAG: hypothetical protein LBI73_14365 [Myroides sp.]|jgi:hypothetical protein|nr:hypothetical protein [Myroides sp.]